MSDIYTIQIRNSVERLFGYMAERTTPDELSRIRRAYELAAEAHSSQRRKSGEPYIIHPIAVAAIVAEELELGDRKSTRLNSSHIPLSRMPSSA